MPHYRIWYERETPGWGGSVRGPILTLEAASEDHAKDEYILQTEPLVWKRHWEGWEEGLREDDVYTDWVEHVTVVTVPPGLRLIQGGRRREDVERRPMEGESGSVEDARGT